MKVSLKWLRDYVNITLPPEQLAEKLTMAGLEVTGITRMGQPWQGIRVAQLMAVAPHPNADRLRLATVDLGGERVTVVCGAPKLTVGDKVAFAPVGTTLIDGHSSQPFVLREAKIRGVASPGMVCSEKELGLSESHEGILVLPPDAPLGMPLSEVLGDALLDIDITPNRPDCLSLLGVAWEVAALTGQSVRSPDESYSEDGPPIAGQTSVEILDPDLCPRYCAALIQGVKIAPSPPWLQERLLSYGMRPINNVVDVTNYVMIEMGQPLHAFDFHTLRGRRIVVRRARPGETLTSLDGQLRELSPERLVIADAERAVAIAGVMGGLDTEVAPQTSAILLEAASFAYPSIRRTGTTLKLRTEASLRFERGLSPELVPHGLRRAVRLILELAGGQAAWGIVDVYPGREERKPIPLPLSELPRLLGINLETGEVVRVLTALGLGCPQVSPELLQVSVPYWRSDLRLSADLVEEVARITGYDRIPTTILSGRLPARQPHPMLALKDQVKDILVACGFQEIIGYSLTSAAKLSQSHSAGGLRVSNPLSAEQEYLRTSLRPGLLSALALNQKFEEGGIRLFEVGKVYLPREGDLPEEREVIGVVLWGAVSASWAGPGREADFYEVKGLAEALFQSLGVPLQFAAGNDPCFHPARQAVVLAGEKPLAFLGELHPAVCEAFDLLTPAYLLEADLSRALAVTGRVPVYQPLPRFPAVVRDIALVIAETTSAQDLFDIIVRTPLVSRAQLFDLYRGAPLPPAHKSLAFRLYFHSAERTLTEAEVNQALSELLEKLGRETGATLRSGLTRDP